MLRFVNAETGEPLDPQVAYFDGYQIADRLLEGVMFEVTIDEDDNFVCNGVKEEDREYYEDFAAKKHKEWQEEVVKLLDRWASGGELVTANNEDVDVVDETGAAIGAKGERIEEE